MEEEIDLSQFKEIFVSESKEHLSVLNSTLLELEKNTTNLNLVNEIFRVAHTLKGMSATMGFDKITNLTHEMESVLDTFKKTKTPPTREIVDILFDCFDNLELLIDEIATGQEKQIEIGPIIQQLKSIIEIRPEIELQKPQIEHIKQAEMPLETSEEQTILEQIQQVSSVKTQSVRIKIEHLDKLMNLVGELVINKARLAQIATVHKIPEFSQTFSQFDRISIDLQEEVMKTRMVPVSHIFDRYPRMVRDLSKKLNKEIEFQIIGSEIEIDRTLLDKINEPLVHLLRNAIDHGIELPETRKNAGKHVAGIIKLIANREKGYVLIEVSDDGKGMDVEKISQKAVEKGLISQESVKQLPENEIFNFICHPAFSTATEITDISGRGVGMDVVKNTVESFNGKLQIQSKKGEGSTFIMHLPLTLSIMQALLVKVSNQTYAIPLTNVSEIAKIDKEYVKTIEKNEVLLLRNEVIPLLSLKKLFNSNSKNEGEYSIIVDISDKKIGFVVDSLIGQQEIVIKTLSGILKHTKKFGGATILGDGRVVLIIDVSSVGS